MLLQHWTPYFEHFNENMSITYGDQIDQEDTAELESEGRPVVNRNIILPKVLQYLGSSIKRRRSVAAFPVDNSGDDVVAAKLSKIFKHTEQDNDLEAVALDVRASAAVTKMGWYYIPPPPVDAEGEDLLVKVYCEPPENILLDADARDLEQRSWKRLVRRNWLSLDDIEDVWPEYIEEVKEKVGLGERSWNGLSERLKVGVRPDSSNTTVQSSGTLQLQSKDVVDRINNLFLVVELWEKKYRRVPGKRKPEEYMLLRVSLPYLDLCLGRFELPLKYYPFVLYQQINFGSTIIDTASYVDQLRPVQEEKNRIASKAEDAASRAISETIILSPGEDKLQQDIKDRGNKPGIYVAAKENPVADRINSSGVNAGFEQLQDRNDVDFEKISVIPPAVGGAAENTSESGTYFDAKVAQGEQAIEIFNFIEWRKTWKLLYRIFLERYQVYYTPEMTFRILGEVPGEYEDVVVNTIDYATGQILDDITLGRYDVTIEDIDYGNSTRDQQLRVIIEIMKSSSLPQIQALLTPLLIKNAPIDDRNNLAAMAQQILMPLLMPPPPPEPGAEGEGGDNQPARQAA